MSTTVAIGDLATPRLQVSLDYQSVTDAVRVGAVALANGVDWLEVGTPLVQSEGWAAVRVMRAAFPDVPIVVDLKAMDGGSGSAARVADTGGTFVVVMAASHPATIDNAVEAAHQRGIYVMADIMGASDLEATARRVADAGVDVIVCHHGVDERGSGSEASAVGDALALARLGVGPVQAVGGIGLDEFAALRAGAVPMAVIGAPLLRYDTVRLDEVAAACAGAVAAFKVGRPAS